jgi:hypothetical protein
VRFLAFQLRSSVCRDLPIMDGRTLNDTVPCPLLHNVTVCKPTPVISENGVSRSLRVSTRHDFGKLVDRLLSIQQPAAPLVFRGEYCPLPRGERANLTEAQFQERMTRVQRRLSRNRDYSYLWDRCIDKNVPFESFTDPRTWYEPNTFVAARPAMAFTDSDMRDNEVPRRFHKVRGRFIASYDAPWRSKKTPTNTRLWQAKAKQEIRRLRTGELLCVKCATNSVESDGAGFILCDFCENNPTETQAAGWQESDWKKNFDFGYVAEHKSGYVCEKILSDKAEKESRVAGACTGSSTRKRRPKIVHTNNYKDHGFSVESVHGKKLTSSQERYTRFGPHHFLSEYEMSKEERKKFAELARPLLEPELAWILAIKFKGFTQEESDAHLKARRAAAWLAAHFVFGRGFAEIAELTHSDKSTVEKFCKAARKSYTDSLTKLRGIAPEEATVALRKRMLQGVYEKYVTEGHRCYSRTCCTGGLSVSGEAKAN